MLVYHANAAELAVLFVAVCRPVAAEAAAASDWRWSPVGTMLMYLLYLLISPTIAVRCCARMLCAGLFLLERLQPQMDLETSQALARLAPLHARADSRCAE
jgi:hypothetical protein